MATISISIVTYNPDICLLSQCISSLNEAVSHGHETGEVSNASITLVDNSTNTKVFNTLQKLLTDIWTTHHGTARLIPTKINLGYGVANNLVINDSRMDYHLILNPDVILEKYSIHRAIQFMNRHETVALLTPNAINPQGNKEYLNKRYPSLLTLFLRGFCTPLIKKIFANKMAYYERRDQNTNEIQYDVLLASGCFMLFRTPVLKKLGGFSDKYFLHFEDFDLSMRTPKYGIIAYVPSVNITHFGGSAAKKGIRHIFLFIRSAITFFNEYGWKLI